MCHVEAPLGQGGGPIRIKLPGWPSARRARIIIENVLGWQKHHLLEFLTGTV